jgi:hypothetical protein
LGVRLKYGEHGGLEGAFLKSLVKAGDHVIEVGANIGAHTVGLAKAVGAQAASTLMKLSAIVSLYRKHR